MTHRDKVVAKKPFCIFCGGGTPSTTVDHVPPRGIFRNRQRPMGLEFGSCSACNSGSRGFEQMVQFISLIGMKPGIDVPETTAAAIIENAIKRNPGLQEEFYERDDISYRQRKLANRIIPDGVVVNASGPVLSEVMSKFAAKLGLALHFETTGRIVPLSGFVVTSWYSNADSLTDRQMLDIAEYLSAPQTLKQGTHEVSDQFQYASAWTPDGTASMHRATFHDVFAVDAIIGETASDFSQPPSDQFYRRPGFLRGVELPPLVFRKTA